MLLLIQFTAETLGRYSTIASTVNFRLIIDFMGSSSHNGTCDVTDELLIYVLVTLIDHLDNPVLRNRVFVTDCIVLSTVQCMGDFYEERALVRLVVY
jgi:hypothetical protein